MVTIRKKLLGVVCSVCMILIVMNLMPTSVIEATKTYIDITFARKRLLFLIFTSFYCFSVWSMRKKDIFNWFLQVVSHGRLLRIRGCKGIWLFENCWIINANLILYCFYHFTFFDTSSLPSPIFFHILLKLFLLILYNLLTNK